MGRIKRKGTFKNTQNAHSDYPAHAQSIIRAFALHLYILKYPKILLAYSEGTDQTARMRRLLWAFAVYILEDTFSHGAAHIYASCEKYRLDPCGQ